MDSGNFFTPIKEKFFVLKEKIQELIDINKKISALVLSLIVLVLILLIIIISSGNKKNKNKGISQQLILTETPLIPDGPEIPEDYNVSRPVEKQWSDEETDIWFTVPSAKEINSLSLTNENLINEIIKAAP